MRQEEKKNVTGDRLASNVAGFAADGAVAIACTKQQNGRWTIVATFRD
ncbi:hypothetical protein [Dongia deserti]|nr:hypothetical protein [Dongia deserti]